MEQQPLTDHKTMNTIVHAAFRRDVARFDTALAQFPAGSQQRADDLLRAWEFFSDELHHHHSYEEQYFWPALQQTEADLTVVAHLDDEHDDMRRALEQATASMVAFQAYPTTGRADATRAAVARLADVLLTHLAHEEADLEPISAAYAKSAVMKQATKKVIRAHLPNLGDFIVWLQDGAAENEKVALRREMPAPVVFLFGTLAGRRYRREIAPVWAEQ